jgi:hypothetical protein
MARSQELLAWNIWSLEPLHGLQPELTATKACRFEEAALSRGDLTAVK